LDFIFDIDGTVAEGEFFVQYIKTKPKNWKLFFDTLHLHETIEQVLTVARSLHASGHNVLFVTARGNEGREQTVRWLHETAGMEGQYQALYMRPEKDYRPDNIIKKEILDQMRLDGWSPVAAFEDRARVAKMWRDNGILCFHVAEGDY
jgi:hypothetical protein